MKANNPISPELQNKIDALADENLKENILRYLHRPWKRTRTNEEIFEEMVSRHERIKHERETWRKWSDDEIRSFITHFKNEMPEEFTELIAQERDNGEIESELSWKARRLAMNWHPDLDFADYGSLIGKVRDHVRTHLIGKRGDSHE